jgi:hypothetical protein
VNSTKSVKSPFHISTCQAQEMQKSSGQLSAIRKMIAPKSEVVLRTALTEEATQGFSAVSCGARLRNDTHLEQGFIIPAQNMEE